MKNVILILTLSFLGSVAFGDFDKDMAQAERTLQKYSQDILAIDGVVGTGVGYCDQAGNLLTASANDMVPCIFVLATDDITVKSLEAQYGSSPTSLDSTMTIYKVVGQIEAFPGGTIGNGQL